MLPAPKPIRELTGLTPRDLGPGILEATEPVVRERLKTMERRLLVMTHVGGALEVALGVAHVTL